MPENSCQLRHKSSLPHLPSLAMKHSPVSHLAMRRWVERQVLPIHPHLSNHRVTLIRLLRSASRTSTKRFLYLVEDARSCSLWFDTTTHISSSLCLAA